MRSASVPDERGRPRNRLVSVEGLEDGAAATAAAVAPDVAILPPMEPPGGGGCSGLVCSPFDRVPSFGRRLLRRRVSIVSIIETCCEKLSPQHRARYKAKARREVTRMKGCAGPCGTKSEG